MFYHGVGVSINNGVDAGNCNGPNSYANAWMSQAVYNQVLWISNENAVWYVHFVH